MSDRHGSNNPIWLILGVGLTCVLGAALIVGLKARAQAEADRSLAEQQAMAQNRRRIDQEPLKTLPPFSLPRARGEEVSLESLKGRVWVADFFFTTCPTICPTMSGKLRDLQERTQDLGEIRFLSITVDPENDDAAALRAYAEKFGADPERWFFLTGEEPVIRELKHVGFGIGDPEDPIMGHSSRFTLIDADGRIRSSYLCADPNLGDSELAMLESDLRELLRRGGR
jgi:protein SCO1